MVIIPFNSQIIQGYFMFFECFVLYFSNVLFYIFRVFYFTFFEMATANRSFVIHLLKEDKNPMKNLGKLSKLREVYLEYALTILEKPIKIEQETVVKIQDKVLQEASWLQFLSIFNFWMNDESPNFEKTDVFIEKSVKASFDLAYNIPTQSVIDFGKFLWKEQMNGMFSKS